ncbi:hypothetical protein RLEG12_00285 (plasmid) [Rhizobium leguminosarum bv. trifolii CB782]|nr:hypothetical protein RLEG12_00285 [Rhizobium leguminosarum bv. trifolii CB782]
MRLTVLGADAGAGAAADTPTRVINNHQHSIDLIIFSFITGTYNFT